MSYKVTAPLVIIANADRKSGDWYGYVDAIVPAGWNDERCKVLAKEGMLEKVKAEPTPDGDAKDEEPKPGTAAFVLKEVGDDKDKAKAALDAENAKAKPGKGLVEALEKILAG